MSPSQIEGALADKVGKVIIASWNDGRSARLRVTSIDQEGFTCYVLDHPDIDQAQEQWFQFDELTGVVLEYS